MSKIKTFLVAIGMVFLALSAKAQLTYTFVPSNPSPELNETITVDVVVTGFTDIALSQYSINWNQSLLSFQGLSNFNLPDLNASSFGTSQTASGIITTSWFAPANPGTSTVPDGTVIYTITFEVIASMGATTDIMFTGTPSMIEFYEGVGLNDITNSVVLNDATLTIAGGGGGGGGTGNIPCTFSGFGLTVSSDSAATGDPVCLDVAVCNFDDILGMSYTMQFDPNLLQFDNVTNLNLADLEPGSFGTNNAGNGLITMAWFDPNGAGVTVPDETVIYSVCFTAIGAGGETDSLLINGALAQIDVTDINSGGSNIGLESIDGEVTITGNSGSAVTLLASQEQGSPGDTVTVDISVRNFDSIIGMQASMLWDPAIISFFDTQESGNLPGSITFNTSSALTNTGRLTFTWNDPGATGVTLADDEIIFSIRYIINGDVADISAVDFTSDPSSIEVSQTVNGQAEIVPLAKIPGLVEVVGQGVLSLTIGTGSGCTGDTVCIGVTPQNFNEILSMQYDVTWNTANLNYINVQNFNPDVNGLNQFNFNLIGGGTRLRVAWSDGSSTPRTVVDGDTLYQMCFEVLSTTNGENLDVSFDQSQLIEISEGVNGDLVTNFNINDGGITVDCSTGPPMEVSDTTINNILCNGDATGSINISIINEVGTVNYVWSHGPTSQDVSGLSAGNYTVTITDDVTTLTETYTVTEVSTAVSVSLASTDVSTNGGNDGDATASPSGGTSPYTYLWNDTNGSTTAMISGLTANTYSVTVTDANGCKVIDQVIVNEPGAVTASITASTDVSCFGGSDGTATVSPGGGVGPYTYLWDDSNGSTTATVTGLSASTYNVTVEDANGGTATTSVMIAEPTAVTVNVTDDNLSCNGADDGTATANPSGGTSPYTYLWDDTNGSTNAMISGLAPGQYNVTVTDANGCTEEGTTFVSEPTVLTVSGTVTHESGMGANNGEIDVTPAGGTSGFTYAWSPNTSDNTAMVTGLAPGDYTVTVTDANSCTAVETFTVNEFDAPQITVNTVVHLNCNGDNAGSIDISVTGGVMPYSYDWDNDGTGDNDDTQDLSGLSGGNYTITVTDGIGTTAVETITINEPSPIAIVLNGQNNINCNGDNTGSINITVTGGTPGYTYDWGNSITAEDPSGLAAGTYTVTVTDTNGCTQIGNPVTITQPTPISITVVSSTNINCNGEATGDIDITVTGGTMPYGYNWGNSITVQDPSGLSAGTYTVTITDANGCTQVGPAVTLSEPDALSASSSATPVSCNGDSDGTITLNVTGGVPNYSYNWNPAVPNPIEGSQTGVSAGTYFVTITDALGCTTVRGPIGVTEPATLTTSNTVINASASNDDGSINLTVNGGTTPYTYDWSNGATTQDISNLSSGCYAVTVEDINGCSVIDSIKVGGIVSITDITSPVSCAGTCDGEIDISISGGIEPYVYSWSGLGVVPNAQNQINLCAGMYSVTVSDSNGSITSQTFTVETPTALTISSTDIQNETGDGCNGSVNIGVTGGTLPYSYQWSNGETSEDIVDLCKGDYNVTVVDANGCVLISSTFTVAPPPLEVALTNTIMASCDGSADGEICISVLGGCGPYDLTLNSETIISTTGEDICFDELAAGSYSIIVEDSGTPLMTTIFSFVITDSDPIVIDYSIVDNTDPTGINCNGSIDITVTGGTLPYTYEWSTGVDWEDPTNLCESPPDYSVTVTDGNGCIQVLDGLIVDLGLSIQVVSTENVSCVDECDGSIDIEVFGGVSPYNYSWNTGDDDPNIFTLCDGTYSVTVTDATGATIAMTGISIIEPSTAFNVTVDSEIRPTADDANGLLSLNTSGGWGFESVLWTGPNGFTASTLTIGGLVEGFYTAVVTDANGCVIVYTHDLIAHRLTLDFELMEPECNGDQNGEITVFVSGGSGDYTITWDSGNSGEINFTIGAGEHCVTITDNIIIGLVVETCVELSEPEILDVALEIANATGPADGSITANVSGGTEAYTYIWSNGESTPTITRLAAGIYGLQVTDANGCEVIIPQIEVVIQGECLEARKVISPNGDGKNDEFIISCVEGLNSNLKIFNRWGQMVYEVDNYDNSWSGTDFDGDLLPESGYFWVLEYEESGQTQQLKGAFTLLRGRN